MADIICRWRNATPKTVCQMVSVLPKEEMSSERFRDIMEKQKLFPDFFHTAYQLACQLSLYCEEDGAYIPRFTREITEPEASAYLSHWIRWYYAPNPFTKSLKKTDHPVYIVEELVNHVTDNGPSNLKEVLETIFKDSMGNLDIVINALNNYSQVLKIENGIVSLTDNYTDYIMDMPIRDSKRSFFQNFSQQSKRQTVPKGSLQKIYYGAPGTGKSYTIDGLTNDDSTIRTTFHPDSDYASFVGAYKPTMEQRKINAFNGTKVRYAETEDGHPGTESKIVYKYVPQAFLKAYVAAWSNLDEPFFLVIEEINRGNCAQIFGDLFQLLDRNNHGSSSYAIAADEDIAQFLADDKKGFAGLSEEQREAISNFVLIKDNGDQVAIGPSILNGSKLLLPPNLRIWATMNTSDQSLFPIDSAFKRRWDWKYVPIEYDKKNWMFEVGGKRYRWGDFLKKINPEIYTLTDSADKQMGYFFAKSDKKSNSNLKENDIISEEVFLNKVLFYLWTDVLKDFDLTKKPFVYEDEDKKNKAFRFTDFFPLPNNPRLNRFVEGLGLVEVDNVDIEESEDEGADGVEDESSNRIIALVDNSKTTLRRTFLEITRKALQRNPHLTLSELFTIFNESNFPKWIKNVFLKRTEVDSYFESSKLDKSADKRYFFNANDYLTDGEGEQFAVSAQGWTNIASTLQALTSYAAKLRVNISFE